MNCNNVLFLVPVYCYLSPDNIFNRVWEQKISSLFLYQRYFSEYSGNQIFFKIPENCAFNSFSEFLN